MPRPFQAPKITRNERRGRVVLNVRIQGERVERWVCPVGDPQAEVKIADETKLLERQIRNGNLLKLLEQGRREREETRRAEQDATRTRQSRALTFKALAEKYEAGYIDSPTGGRRGRGLKDRRCAKLRLKQLVDELGDRLVVDLTSEAIEAFKNRRAAVVSGPTVNRGLAVLSHVFTWAAREKLIPQASVNPVRGVKRLPESEARDEFFASEADAEAVLSRCPEVLRGIVVLARNTGMRRGELLGVTWSQVNKRSRMIELRGEQTKSGYPRRVALNDAALDVLASLPRSIDGEQRLFTHPDGRPVLADWVTKRFAKALKKSGIVGIRRFHGCRHDTASQLAMAGRSLAQVGAVLGHRSPGMTTRYAHLAPEALVDVVKTLDEVRKRSCNLVATEGQKGGK